MTAYFEDKNKRMNRLIDSSLLIGKYFEKIDDCLQFTDDGKTLYMEAQVIKKAHHAVLASGIYVDTCKEWRKKSAIKQMWIRFRIFL